MKIPKTTKAKPYIEFIFDKTGELFLKASSDWWGGINHCFSGPNEIEGNTCPPEHLDKYIKAFKQKKIKQVNKEIANLEKWLAKLEEKYK